jgi:hypothetical protein
MALRCSINLECSNVGHVRAALLPASSTRQTVRVSSELCDCVSVCPQSASLHVEYLYYAVYVPCASHPGHTGCSVYTAHWPA